MTRPDAPTADQMARAYHSVITKQTRYSDHGMVTLPTKSGRKAVLHATKIIADVAERAATPGTYYCPTCKSRGHRRPVAVRDSVLRHRTDAADIVAAAERLFGAAISSKVADRVRSHGPAILFTVGCSSCNEEDKGDYVRECGTANGDCCHPVAV